MGVQLSKIWILLFHEGGARTCEAGGVQTQEDPRPPTNAGNKDGGDGDANEGD